MKTAGRENPNHGVAWPRNRAHGAVAQNRSRSLKWAAKQEKFQPKERSFFLTSTFIERSGTLPPLLPASTRHTLRTRHSGSGSKDESISAFFSCRNTASSRDALDSARCCADLEDRRDEHAANPGPKSSNDCGLDSGRHSGRTRSLPPVLYGRLCR